MREHFMLSLPNLSGKSYSSWITIIVCLIISFVIVYPVMGFGSMESFLAIFLLFLIIYVIVISMSNENLSNELPRTLYPSSPHLGLDGISLNALVAGTNT